MSNSLAAPASASLQTGTGRALAIHAATLCLYLAASSVPTPLYRLYQTAWHFSPVLLTVIFAVYALALLATLIVAGALSDYLGRRPVISLALVLQAGAMGLFFLAEGPEWLIAARLLQGVATALATASLGAILIDLHHEHGALTNSIAPMIGMAIGALGATALVQLAPWPLHLVFAVVIGLCALQLILTWTTPETAPRRHGAFQSLKPSISVPATARAALLLVTPINVSVWMMGGFYLSLMPSLIARVTGSNSAWLGGLSVAVLTLSGSGTILIMRRHRAFLALVLGASMILLGTSIILTGADLGQESAMLIGSAVAGIGFGSGFLGSMRSVLPLAAPQERAGLMAAFYVESYLAFSLPTIAAGVLAQYLGLLAAANIYGALLIVLVVCGLVMTLLQARHQGA